MSLNSLTRSSDSLILTSRYRGLLLLFNHFRAARTFSRQTQRGFAFSRNQSAVGGVEPTKRTGVNISSFDGRRRFAISDGRGG